MKNLCALIMAAGKGTRMVSNQAKVLHKVCGIPMIEIICRAVSELEPEAMFVIIGQDSERVRASLAGYPVTFILQEQQLGTGHAVITAREQLKTRQGDVLVLFGDTPRIRETTLRKLVEHHQQSGAHTTLLTTFAPDPHGYGRILRRDDGRIQAIVEEKDATSQQRKITEINPGFYCFKIAPLLQAIEKLSNNNAQKEYYITDLIEIQNGEGMHVDAVPHEEYDELRGINTRRELAEASQALRQLKNNSLMAAGVTLIDPDRTYIDMQVEIGKDTIIYPLVTIEGASRIGEGAIIRPGARISHSTIGPEVEILDSCLITDSEVHKGTSVGPLAHLRKHAVVGKNCRIGNFVEIKKSTLGEGTKAAHLAYLGDSQIGRNVNIGAGVITCNYDGFSKNATIIEDEAFIGSDSQLIAPVKIGRGAYIAAGSCITADVPPESLGIARERQINKENWARRKKASRKES